MQGEYTPIRLRDYWEFRASLKLMAMCVLFGAPLLYLHLALDATKWFLIPVGMFASQLLTELLRLPLVVRCWRNHIEHMRIIERAQESLVRREDGQP